MSNELYQIELGEASAHLRDLADIERWVAWRTADGKKIPVDPKTGRGARTNDPTTWATYAAAVQRASRINGSVGIVLGGLGKGLHLCGVDLDTCIMDGKLARWAEEVIYRFETYAETSPSGGGVKLFFYVTADDRAGFTTNRVQFVRGAHEEMALDLGGRYYATTFDPVDDLIGERPLRVVGRDDLVWFTTVAGPAFKGKADATAIRDESGSGYGYRFMCDCVRRGLTFEDAHAEILADPDEAGDWAREAGGRQLERAFQAAARKTRRTADAFTDDDAVAELVGDVEADDPVTARLNRQFATVRHEGKTLIADTRDGLSLGTVDHLHQWFANDLVPTPNGKSLEPASRRWMRDPQRRQYESIVFDPSGRAHRRALNLWAGWAVDPDPEASCALILDHIRTVWAAGNEEHATYILGWLAHLVQRPGVKPDVALVLKGRKGAGKDVLVKAFRKILGHHVAHVNRPDVLTSRFNAPMATALLVHVEEAFWSGDRSKRGTLQSLVTAPSIPLERKGIDPIEIDSFCRLLMTTNETWAVPASHDERRYAVFDVSDARVGDRAYFKALAAEIEGDGPAALLAHLQAVDLSGFEPRQVPKTDALRDQKWATLQGLQAWWGGVLMEGVPPGRTLDFDETPWADSPVTVDRTALRETYEEWQSRRRFEGPAVNPAWFGRELRTMLPSVSECRPWADEGVGRRRMYSLPSLCVCRREFETWFGSSIDWGAD